jgi:glyoxylase-like metal-dependent hydrolase (beta-lactamase superfamily II)
MQRSLEFPLTLPDETVVRPGHGPDTTIGRERLTNPFLLDIASQSPVRRGL